MMMKGGSVEVKAPSETAAVDIVAPALLRLGAPLPPPISVAVTASAATRTGDGLLDAEKRMRWTIFVSCPAHFHVFLLHEKVTDDEGVPSLVSNLSVQVFYHMKKLLMTGKSSVEVKAPSETAAVDIVAREQESPAVPTK